MATEEATTAPAPAWKHQGQAALEGGRFDEALEAFTKALEEDSADASAWFGQALAHANLNHAAEAERALDKALELAPDFARDPVFLLARARVWNALGKPGQALAAAEAGLGAGNNEAQKPWLLLQRAAALDHLNRAGEAAEAMGQAAQNLPPGDDRDYARMRQILLLEGLGRIEDLVKVIDQALEEHPEATAFKGYFQFRKGIALNNLSRYGEALGALEEAAKLVPENEQAFLWLQKGAALNALGRPADALECLDQALKLIPEAQQGLAWLQRGIALNALKRQPEAIAALDSALRLIPDSDQGVAWLQKGVALNSLGRYREAIAALENAVSRIPAGSDRGYVWLQLGVALNALGERPKALEALDRTIELVPVDSVRGIAWFQKAVALNELGRPAEALSAVEEAGKLNHELEGLSDFWFVKIAVFASLGRAEQAVAELDQLAEQRPAMGQHPLLQVLKGNLLIVMGRTRESMAAYTEASQVRPEDEGDANAWLGVGEALVTLNEAPRGLEAFDKAMELNPALQSSPVVLLFRGVALENSGQHQEALDCLNQIGGETDLIALTKGMALAGLKRAEEAFQTLDRAAELAGRSPSTADFYRALVYQQKGFILAGLERYNEALAAFGESIDHLQHLPPDHPVAVAAWFGKGLTLARMKRSDEAIEALDRAARLAANIPPQFPFPLRALPWSAKAQVLTELGRDDEALVALNRGLAVDPQNAEVVSARANTLARLGEEEQAARAFQQAAALAGNDKARLEACLGEGACYSRVGTYERAVAVYRDALDRGLADGEDSWKLWEALGDAYRALGRPEASLRAFQRGWKADQSPKRSSALALGISSVLLELKQNEEALNFLTNEAAGRSEPDPRLDFNRGVALYRLKHTPEAIQALQVAADQHLDSAIDVLGRLGPAPRQRAWNEYWFSREGPLHRKVLGVALVAGVFLIALLPLIKANSIARLSWLNTGQDWKFTGPALLVLIALLLLPVTGKLKLAGVEIEPSPSSPELPAPAAPRDLLDKLPPIGPTPAAQIGLLGRIPLASPPTALPVGLAQQPTP